MKVFLVHHQLKFSMCTGTEFMCTYAVHILIYSTDDNTLLLYFLSYFPLMVSDAIPRPLCNVNNLWNIIMILHSYVEQVMTICHVQELQLSLSYFPNYFHLIFSDAISCPLYNLNTLLDFIRILHIYVEHILTMCHIQK